MITYSTMISAYGNSGKWQKAEELFAELQSKKWKPELITFSAMLSAYGKSGQWCTSIYTNGPA
jgi:pentatricopeptide repeat protein